MAKSDWQVHGIDPNDGKGTTIRDYFEAACKLDVEWIKKIIYSNNIDVNCTYCYGQATHSNIPDSHMVQSFGFAKTGRATMQLFEKIDLYDEDDVEKAIDVLQVVSDSLR